ncbi:MAG: hypothetical protein FJ399_24020, partial [Verrucomicrobia bacterium]|nr:hypothetical protein [Verrucomicrobiota bacterium]
MIPKLGRLLLLFAAAPFAGCLSELAASSVAAAVADPGRPASAPAKADPNVVLILADDLGWTDLACFGSDLHETPHLDRLAREGMRFTQNYSACTVCSPTRAALLTGQYPARLHITDWIPGAMPYAAIRAGDFKLIEFFHDLRDSKIELYNLRDDLGEQHDLAAAQLPSPNPRYDPTPPEY